MTDASEKAAVELDGHLRGRIGQFQGHVELLAGCQFVEALLRPICFLPFTQKDEMMVKRAQGFTKRCVVTRLLLAF